MNLLKQPETGLPINVPRSKHHPLDIFFVPRTIAVIGATDWHGSMGRSVRRNLIRNPPGGTVFPVSYRVS